MFLAWHELMKAKLRFSLIIGVLALMSYLVFLLSGLANGLEQLNREAIDQWHAHSIVLSDDSDLNLSQSSMTINQAKHISTKQKAELIQLLTVVKKKGTEIKQSAALIGINRHQMLMPRVTEGRAFTTSDEAIADDSLKTKGFKRGDQLTIASSEQKLKIVGFVHHIKYNAAPVLYTRIAAVQKIKYGKSDSSGKGMISGVVLRSKNADPHLPSSLKQTSIKSFIENLPGYTPQKISLNFMIYFLFIIASVTIGIFLYVLTIQKVSVFGVLRAEGVPSYFLIQSVVAQTFLLALFGVVIGLVLTAITAASLPDVVPIQFNSFALLIYGLTFILIATLGSLFSVRTIVRIDPVKAIGG